MAAKKIKKPAAKKADASLREDLDTAVSESERRRILAEQAPRVKEAERRLAGKPAPAEPVVEAPRMGPSEQPLAPDESGEIVKVLRNYEPFKTMHALITKNARTADKALNMGE